MGARMRDLNPRDHVSRGIARATGALSPEQLADVAGLVHSRALDEADERMLADMLGLTPESQQLRTSAKSVVDQCSKAVHGTRGGVEAHEAAGQWLCDPCQRWADVQARKQGAIAQARAVREEYEAAQLHPGARRLEHGTLSRYVKGCRCEQCTEANRERTRARRAAHAGTPAEEFRHGATGYTDYGCRCETCKDGHRVSCRESQLRRAAREASA